MKPQDVIFQLFGQAGIDAIDDVDFDGVFIGTITYNGVQYESVRVNYSDGIAYFYESEKGCTMRLAIKVELVPLSVDDTDG